MSLTQSNCKEITNKEKGRQQRRRNRGGHNGPKILSKECLARAFLWNGCARWSPFVVS